ncbi:hypothetical protein BH11PLA2_BH11PLA2_38470 [soil metagenome]
MIRRMAGQRRTSTEKRKVPKVRIARPSGRPYQLRYYCPKQKREIRVSLASRDEREATQRKKELEAELLLGIESKLAGSLILGPEMPWEDFREQFRVLHLASVRNSTSQHAESCLDITERILKPKTLGDVADGGALHQLQAKLLAGSCSRRRKPRSSHTVRGYMSSILAALNWAHLQGWLPVEPKVRRIKTPRMKVMKGRPITAEEFQKMVEATPGVVGEVAAASWVHVLRGLWESSLRLDELMHVSWDKPGTIRPVWKPGQLPVLEIPSSMQKNNTEERIPLLPWFETLLNETEPEKRRGWVFKPISLQIKLGRDVRHQRPETGWVGKIIQRIGRAADIVVVPADDHTGHPTKYATAHDMRRSCGERLRDAGIPPLVICSVMRHSSWETTRRHYAPGNIQRDAEVLKKLLSTEEETAQAAK